MPRLLPLAAFPCSHLPNLLSVTSHRTWIIRALQRTSGHAAVKLFVLKLSMAIANGHFCSLRLMPKSHHIWFIISSTVFPLMPAFDLVFKVIRTLWNVRESYNDNDSDHDERDRKYILGSIAGVYCSANSPSAESKRLTQLCSPSDLRSNAETCEKLYLRIGRLIAILECTAQVVAILFLLIRRINIVGMYGFQPDEHALDYNVSGIAVSV